MAFVHLHVHSEYSPLDGMIRLDDGFAKVAEDGQRALAITDHGNLAGAWAAQKAADKAGVKFIAGEEVYLAVGSRHEKNVLWVPADDSSADEDTERSTDKSDAVDNAGSEHQGMKSRPYMHLTVLATSAAGWQNLVALNNKAHETKWHKPRIDIDLLAQHSDGLIVLTGCLGGPVLGPASRGDMGAAGRNLDALIGAVGKENVFVELMDHGISEESAVLPYVVDLARDRGVGVVATGDAHYTNEADAEAHKALLLMQSKSTIENPKFQFHGHGYWLRTEAEMRAVRPESWWQEACDTTQVIADRCQQRTLPERRNLMPKFETPDGYTSNKDYLFALLRDGADRKYGGIDQELRDRVMMEMDVIDGAGMLDYFLIVHDLISWARSDAPSTPGGAKKAPILVGPGRGSAAGSEVAYLLDITAIPPRPNGLLFERFYELGRSEPPDIDIDFPQGRRQEVIQYLRDRWGADRVASIGTANITRTKAAILGASRVLGVPAVGAQMTKLVPTVDAKPMPVTDLLDPDSPSTTDYRRLLEKSAQAQTVHELAGKFENIISGYSIHASGVIVAAEPLHDLVPMRLADGNWVLEWTGPEAENIGLLKVDVLGLRNLDIIERAVEYIRDTTGEYVDPRHLPDSDTSADERDAARVAAAWDLIAEGRTAGVFQMESSKMTELAMRIAPRTLAEEAAIVALYRPGPMSMGAHTSYADRKRGIEPVDYRVFTSNPVEQEALASVLGETHGLIVYQEQVMRLGTVMAGFDATGRSKLRKAVSKKKKELLDEIQPLFFEQASKELRDSDGNVVSPAFATSTVQAVWDTILEFAAYAFNKSHAATYGYLAYMTAFYKANWPASYAAANLAVTGGTEKRLQVLESLRREGVSVLAPDVNATTADTAPVGENTIRIGLSEVRGVGSAGDLIVAERNRGGEFSSLRDLIRRVPKPSGSGSGVSSAHLKAIISSGAADRFGPRLGLMVTAGALHAKDVPVPAMEWGVLERSARQREMLLVPVSEHPLTVLQDQVQQYRVPTVLGGERFDVRPTPVAKIPDTDGARVQTLGVLAAWTERTYSRGRLASITVEGSTASISGAMWDRALSEAKQADRLPQVGDVVLATATVRNRVIDADPNDPTSETQTLKELSVHSVTGVPVSAPQTGELPESALPRIDFTAALPAEDADVVDRGLAPSKQAPDGAAVGAAEAFVSTVLVAQDRQTGGVGLVTHQRQQPLTVPGSGDAGWQVHSVAWDAVPTGMDVVSADSPSKAVMLITKRTGVDASAVRGELRRLWTEAGRVRFSAVVSAPDGAQVGVHVS